MAEIDEEKQKVPDPRRRRIVVAAAVVLALVVSAYFGLCGYVCRTDRILPNTSADGVALGGLTHAQAAERVNTELTARFADRAVTFAYDGQDGRSSVSISAGSVAVDADAAAGKALLCGRENGVLLTGWGFLRGLLGGYQVEVPLYFSDESAIDSTLASVAQAVDRPVTETTYTITDASLLLQKGEPGRTVDLDGLKARILAAFENGEARPAGDDSQPGDAAFFLNPDSVYPAELDLDGLYDEIHTEMRNAAYDPETHEITLDAVGVSFDVSAARELYEHTGWGSVCQVPLILTQPETTYEQLHALLFRDLLGACTTTVGGTANRASNVALAASFCNGTIIMPGAAFSYNGTVGSRTLARGFLPAPAYVNGETVDEIGGGICQGSSTIYLAALRSNLKILERQNHGYAVGYVPDGMDATVYYGSLDFRFENNTAYPIKLVAVMKDRKLTVQLYGTKTDDITVKMESVRLTTIPYETIYRIDNSIAPGTSKVSVTPYIGRKVEAYRCLYDGSGKLVSRTLESVNNYRKRDKVVLINAADAARYGIDPVTGLPAPVVNPTPAPTAEPTPAPTAEPTPEPTAEPTPGPTTEPTPAPTAEPTPAPTAEPTPGPTAELTPEPTADPSGELGTPSDQTEARVTGTWADLPLLTPYI